MVPPSQDCGERCSHKGRVAGAKNFCLSPPPPMGWWAWLCPCSTLHPNFSTGQMQGGLVGRVPNGQLEAKLVGSLSLSWGSLQWQSRGTLGSQRSGRRDPGSDGGRLLLEAVSVGVICWELPAGPVPFPIRRGPSGCGHILQGTLSLSLPLGAMPQKNTAQGPGRSGFKS